MKRYREYKEIDERYVKGRKVDVHKKYVKYFFTPVFLQNKKEQNTVPPFQSVKISSR